jgi:transcription elongation GreA/GreB family factor
MISYEYWNFAIELADHIRTRDEFAQLSSETKGKLDALSSLEDEIFKTSRLYEQTQIELSKLKKDYDAFNMRFGFGEKYPDFESNKKKRNDTWERIYKAGARRDMLLSNLQDLRYSRDIQSRDIKTLRSKLNETEKFFEKHKNTVSLYSVVELDLQGEVFEFILLTDELRRNVSLGNLDNYSIESPLGKSCVGKQISDEVTYTAPSGQEISGSIKNCNFPTLDQIQIIIDGMNQQGLPNPTSTSKLDLAGWSSNNSRYRKGG